MSDTSKTRTRRELRRARAGRARKRSLEKNGTTPAFPIHLDATMAPPANDAEPATEESGTPAASDV